MTYQEWIKENVSDVDKMCSETTLKMLKVFPELTRVRGHYLCKYEGMCPHWWLTDPDSNIIDPTAAQFLSNGQGSYLPLDEDQPEPTGKCHNCGVLVYNGEVCCNDLCNKQYAYHCLGR